MKYNHFELKNICFDAKKFPMLCRSYFFFFNLTKFLAKRRLFGAAHICFFVPNAAYIRANTVIRWKLSRKLKRSEPMQESLKFDGRSKIVRATVVGDTEIRFDNQSGNHLQT